MSSWFNVEFYYMASGRLIPFATIGDVQNLNISLKRSAPSTASFRMPYDGLSGQGQNRYSYIHPGNTHVVIWSNTERRNRIIFAGFVSEIAQQEAEAVEISCVTHDHAIPELGWQASMGSGSAQYLDILDRLFNYWNLRNSDMAYGVYFDPPNPSGLKVNRMKKVDNAFVPNPVSASGGCDSTIQFMRTVLSEMGYAYTQDWVLEDKGGGQYRLRTNLKLVQMNTATEKRDKAVLIDQVSISNLDIGCSYDDVLTTFQVSSKTYGEEESKMVVSGYQTPYGLESVMNVKSIDVETAVEESFSTNGLQAFVRGNQVVPHVRKGTVWDCDLVDLYGLRPLDCTTVIIPDGAMSYFYSPDERDEVTPRAIFATHVIDSVTFTGDNPGVAEVTFL